MVHPPVCLNLKFPILFKKFIYERALLGISYYLFFIAGEEQIYTSRRHTEFYWGFFLSFLTDVKYNSFNRKPGELSHKM